MKNLILFFLLLLSVPTLAQVSKKDFSTSNYFFKRSEPNNNFSLFDSHNHLKFSPELLLASVGVTGALLMTDDQTYEIIRNYRNKYFIFRKVSPLITQLGNGKFALLLFGGLGAYHFITKDNNTGKAALLGIESFLLSGITVQILKHTFGRQRPSNRTADGGAWDGPFLINRSEPLADFDAFPSGHTATIFAAASALSYIYPSGAVPYISYGVATIVALSLVAESTHWLSDCFVGGLIGYFSTKLIYKLNFDRTNYFFSVSENYIGYHINFSYNL
jgi:membrane-associated phospholipid phosphatase